MKELGPPRDTPTPRQQEALDLLPEGLSNAEIGERMCLTTKTVRNMFFLAFRHLGVHTRARATIEVTRRLGEC